MKERPINLFSFEASNALRNEIIQIRRPIKLSAGNWDFIYSPRDNNFYIFRDEYRIKDDISIKCSFGQVGDRLWVRETWTSYAGRPFIRYKADNHNDIGWKWRPSIHMPRWASRITLEITDVRVERVQDISRADIYAEGITDTSKEVFKGCSRNVGLTQKFRHLWNSIYGKTFSWGSNPWCWVIDFKRIK